MNLKNVVGDQLAFSFSQQEIVKNRFATLGICCEGNLINGVETSKGLDVGMVGWAESGSRKKSTPQMFLVEIIVPNA